MPTVDLSTPCHPGPQRSSQRGGCFPVLYLLLLAALGGCATAPLPTDEQTPTRTEAGTASELPQWWYLRFRLKRDANDEVRSYLDLLIADQLFFDVVSAGRLGDGLWRFHRRWPLDATGHQFSFIFLAPRSQAESLIAEVERSVTLEDLRNAGHLIEFRVDMADPLHAADPAATSDPSWPPVVQREWPHLIMGASRMWLGLIRDEATKHAELDLHRRYQVVEAAIDRLWFEHGNHAFLHHLSALFGYKPVRVIRRDIMTF